MKSLKQFGNRILVLLIILLRIIIHVFALIIAAIMSCFLALLIFSPGRFDRFSKRVEKFVK